jgi:hypothetical protein
VTYYDSTTLADGGWLTGTYKGNRNLRWTYPAGVLVNKLPKDATIGKIWDVVWANASTHIAEYSSAKEGEEITAAYVNLFLASKLVMGLVPQPEVELYFSGDDRGIFGNVWLQQRFSRDRWHWYNAHLHLDPKLLCSIIRNSSQSVYEPTQTVTVDEMMIPFQGRWAHRQHILGKPHSTGMKPIVCHDSQ